MDLRDYLIIILTNQVVTAALLAGIGFIGKSFIEQWLNKSLEKYKFEMQKTLKYHEKRLEIMDELYKLLQTFSQESNRVVSQVIDNRAKGKTFNGMSLTEILNSLHLGNHKGFISSWSIAWDYYNKNRIYLSENLSNQISGLLLKGYVIQLSLAAVSDFEKYNTYIPLDLNDILLEIKDSDPFEFAEHINSNFSKVFADLEKEFRDIMEK